MPGLGGETCEVACLQTIALRFCTTREVTSTLQNEFVFLKDFIYLFLDTGEGREKERERNINVWLPLVCPLLGTLPAT